MNNLLRFILEILSEHCDRKSLLPPESKDVKNVYDSANAIINCITKDVQEYKKLKAMYVGKTFIIVNEDITKDEIERYTLISNNEFEGFSSMYLDKENDGPCKLWINQEALVLLNEIAEDYPEVEGDLNVCNNANINL